MAIGLLVGETLNAPYGGMFGFCLLRARDGIREAARHAAAGHVIGMFHALTLGLGLCLLVAVTRQFNVRQVRIGVLGSLLL